MMCVFKIQLKSSPHFPELESGLVSFRELSLYAGLGVKGKLFFEAMEFDMPEQMAYSSFGKSDMRFGLRVSHLNVLKRK